MRSFVQGEPNFIIFDVLVLVGIVAFFIRFFTGEVDYLMGVVALCMVAIWVYLYYYLPRVVEKHKPNPRLDELISLWGTRPLTPEEYEEMHELLDAEEA